jgi:hypothetical protein
VLSGSSHWRPTRTKRRHPLEEGGVRITTFVPLRFKKRGLRRVVVGPEGIAEPMAVTTSAPAIPPCHDPALIKALGRGHYWQHLLDTGAVADTTEIATREGLHKVTVNGAVRFALLAPDIVQAALDGRLPRSLSLEALQRESITLDWAQQRLWMESIG